MSVRAASSLVGPIALVLLCVARGAATQAPAPGGAIALLSSDGRRSLPTTMIGDQEFAGLDDLAAAFHLAVQEESGAITVAYKGRIVILTPDQALASVAGRLVSLPAGPVRSGRRWLVPLEFVSRALAPIYDVRLDLRKPARLLIVGDLRVPRLTARYESVGGAGRLTIDAAPRTPSAVVQEAGRLTIRFDADAIDAPDPLLAPQPPASLVRSARAAGPVTVVVELGSQVEGVRSSAEQTDAATRLTIDLVAGAAPAESGATAPAAPAGLPPALAPVRPALRTIAIDAGHGGDDDGVIGPGGSREKDVTLAIAERLKTSIESRLGIRVLLTRDADRLMALDERTALANNNKADLFISLHANGALRADASGATIYSASFARDAEEEARASAAPERLPALGGGLRDIELVKWDLAQSRHAGESAAFARLLEEALSARVPMAAPAVEQAPLRVLQSANMPAVLVEMGFLTNPAQEQALGSTEFQSALVQGIYDSLVRFRDRLAAGGTP
ncbi:MAG: N-acetylmuramoyl-L-alanine amidase [Acidobacteria bacterium]|nr:N-acetylmuramoyl-L-alanine amidase [Acidobacteriota bacterium]